MTWLEIALRIGGLAGACYATTRYRDRRPAMALFTLMFAVVLAVAFGVNVGLSDFTDGIDQ